jgi:hypothetical protein
MSAKLREACKRTLVATAQRVLGCPLDFEQPGSQEDFFRVKLVTPTGVKIDIGYLSIGNDGRVVPHYKTTTALQLVVKEAPAKNRPAVT